MKYKYIGKFVDTHGIKGEIRVISDISYKDLVFKKDVILYLGEQKEPFTIAEYRVHKKYDMVTFKNITNINEIIGLKKSNVYVSEDIINRFVIEDLKGYQLYFEDNLAGEISTVYKNVKYFLVVNDILIPYHEDLILSVDHANKIIKYTNMKGLIP